MRDTGAMLPEGMPQYLNLGAALTKFALTAETQGQQHIRPLHQYIALRLVFEGGFLPDEITPHPPLVCERKGRRNVLESRGDVETSSEKTVIGGLKSKDIDVVVTKPDLGPVVAISVKGTGRAFRNLTNRMEEAIGDCTNLHIMYPGLVYGFLALIKANREGQRGIGKNDVCLLKDGSVVESVSRYHDILAKLTGRTFVRDEPTRYEAVGLMLVESRRAQAGSIFQPFPRRDSSLRAESFFDTIYGHYDLRYPYMAGRVRSAQRVAWDEASPAFSAIKDNLGADLASALGYVPRLA